MININFVASYGEILDLNNAKEFKKLERIKNAKKRRSNGTAQKTKYGYRDFSFVSK